MIDKNERQYFPGQDVQGVIQTIQGALYHMGIPTQQTGPSQWGGRAAQASYGLAPKVQLAVAPAQGGFFVDARVSADFETNGLIIFVVLWFLFFPAAIVIGVLAYQDFSNRTQHLHQAIWAPVMQRMTPAVAPPAMHPPAAAPPPGWGGS
jgi:hypothetical protein